MSFQIGKNDTEKLQSLARARSRLLAGAGQAKSSWNYAEPSYARKGLTPFKASPSPSPPGGKDPLKYAYATGIGSPRTGPDPVRLALEKVSQLRRLRDIEGSDGVNSSDVVRAMSPMRHPLRGQESKKNLEIYFRV